MGFLLPMRFERNGGRWTGKYGRKSKKFNRASFVQSKLHMTFMRIHEQRLKRIQEAKWRLHERQEEADPAAGLKPNEAKRAFGVRQKEDGSKLRRILGRVLKNKQENFTEPASRMTMTQDGF